MAHIIAFPKRPKRRGRKPTKPPACPVFKLEDYRPQVAPEVLYHQASAIDEDPSQYEKAERLYREAIRIRPDYALAMTNLGNVRYRLGHVAEAESWYLAAIGFDPKQSEAWYNLGYLLLEHDRADEAVTRLRRAIELDPSFADAHYNLAMALERLELPYTAQPHWRRYVELEPVGRWSDIARRHITEDTTQPKLRIVR